MKTLKSLLLVLILTVFASNMQANDWQWEIDGAHSNISFTVNHFFNPIPGTFSNFDGTLIFNPEDAANTVIDVAVQVESINTDVERRDNHLRSGDFFGIEEFPEMHFRSTDVRHVEGTNYVAVGQLTIKDVTREVEMPFEFLGVTDHLMREDKLVAGLKGNLTLNRNDYGVGVDQWASTAVIGDEVNITISLQVLKDK